MKTTDIQTSKSPFQPRAFYDSMGKLSSDAFALLGFGK